MLGCHRVGAEDPSCPGDMLVSPQPVKGVVWLAYEPSLNIPCDASSSGDNVPQSARVEKHCWAGRVVQVAELLPSKLASGRP
jgi:hypothetical protein